MNEQTKDITIRALNNRLSFLEDNKYRYMMALQPQRLHNYSQDTITEYQDAIKSHQEEIDQVNQAIKELA